MITSLENDKSGSSLRLKAVIMALSETANDECSLENIETVPYVQTIQELLITLHNHTNQRQKLESDIVSALEQQGHIKSYIQCAIDDVKKRLQWEINSQCKVFVEWRQKWRDGIICNISTSTDEKENTEDTEWLTVKYVDVDSKTKKVKRFSSDLKSVKIDDTEYTPKEQVMEYIAQRFQSAKDDHDSPFTNNLIRNLEEKYSDKVIELLDAVHHLKYEHAVDEDDYKFDEIFEFFQKSLTGKHCDVNECIHVQRHYGDRRRRRYIHGHMGHEHDLLLDTIAMIHCYFVHSFDIDRLTKEEREIVYALDEHEQLTMITNILIEKRKKLKYVSNERNGRYAALLEENAEDLDETEKLLDFKSMAQVLGVQEMKIEVALEEYKEDRNRLLSDLIDVVYGEEEEKTNIWDKFEMEDKEKVMTFRSLLFDHFKCSDLNHKYFMKMS